MRMLSSMRNFSIGSTAGLTFMLASGENVSNLNTNQQTMVSKLPRHCSPANSPGHVHVYLSKAPSSVQVPPFEQG